MTKRLIIMRGLPGSGKSTMVKTFTQQASDKRLTCTVHSTDDFHLELKGGLFEYVFKPDKLRYFHEQNLAHADTSMSMGVNVVIIDNTNTTWKEIKPYVEAGAKHGYDIEVTEPTTSWAKDPVECAKRNTHGVPLEAIQRMLDRWEKPDSILNKMVLLASNSSGRQKIHKDK